jgi:hypothetical protein
MDENIVYFGHKGRGSEEGMPIETAPSFCASSEPDCFEHRDKNHPRTQDNRMNENDAKDRQN